jgi:hypothetical protein
MKNAVAKKDREVLGVPHLLPRDEYQNDVEFIYWR